MSLPFFHFFGSLCHSGCFWCLALFCGFLDKRTSQFTCPCNAQRGRFLFLFLRCIPCRPLCQHQFSMVRTNQSPTHPSHSKTSSMFRSSCKSKLRSHVETILEVRIKGSLLLRDARACVVQCCFHRVKERKFVFYVRTLIALCMPREFFREAFIFGGLVENFGWFSSSTSRWGRPTFCPLQIPSLVRTMGRQRALHTFMWHLRCTLVPFSVHDSHNKTFLVTIVFEVLLQSSLLLLKASVVSVNFVAYFSSHRHPRAAERSPSR